MSAAVRVALRVANLASKYQCSNPFGFPRSEVFYFYLKKTLRYNKKKLSELQVLNPETGFCQLPIDVASLPSKYDRSNSFGFRDMAFDGFSEIWRYHKVTELEIRDPIVGVLSGYN